MEMSSEPKKKRPRVPGSRRELKERREAKKQEDLSKYKASTVCVRDFLETHTGDETLKSVLEMAFHHCGEPILKFLKQADDGTGVPAAQTGRWLVQMGLMRPDHYASSFGGIIDISGKSLKDLRELAKQAGIAAYTKTTEGRREYISIEQLREACRPLLYTSPHTYKTTIIDRRKQTLAKLRALQSLPGEDEHVERELNRRVVAYSVPKVSPDLLGSLGLPRDVLADGHGQIPLAYRLSLALHASDIWADFKGRPRIDREIVRGWIDNWAFFSERWNIEVNIKRDIPHTRDVAEEAVGSPEYSLPMRGDDNGDQ